MSDGRKNLRTYAIALDIGFSMAGALILSLLIGWGLDSWLNTTPLFIAIFSILGVGAALRNFYVISKKLD